MSNDSGPRTWIGCATVFAITPASIIWYVLFGSMLYRTHAETWEWSLYVGYLVLSAIGLALGSLFRVVD